VTGQGIAVDLRRRLADFSASDPEEREEVRTVLGLSEDPTGFSAANFEPGHITASAFVVHPVQDAVALILHSKMRRWLQPGGHVEVDDSTILEAALREVREEIGIGPADSAWLCDIDIHVFPERSDVPRHLHHDVRLAFTADSTDIVAGDGADDVRWWPFTDALGLDESIARPVRKLIEWRSRQ
jgi:8-oxo-dGTP pyrophosphatase MutT (NUDIX family)